MRYGEGVGRGKFVSAVDISTIIIILGVLKLGGRFDWRTIWVFFFRVAEHSGKFGVCF